MNTDWHLVLGLEVHLHLTTANKMFCGCDANFYTSEPNTHTCPVCLGMPGALPVPNYDAVTRTQLLGVALRCSLNNSSKFDRKHYFYPDLPKGYQISQYKEPLCINGYLDLDSGNKADIERIHLEEDVAKSFHQGIKTLVDFNKSGVPLVEIVTRPTFKTVEDAVDFCKQVQEIVRTLKIGDVDMEKGEMRLEANISMRSSEMEQQNELPNYKVEIKNINSFKFMEKAVKAEMTRQSEMLNNGETVKQENRGFNEASGKTVSQREKEEAHDYRYFPEPDIPPMTFTHEHFTEIKKLLPELPYDRKARYMKLGVTKQEAGFLSSTENMTSQKLFENLVASGKNANKVASILLNKSESRSLTQKEFEDLLEPAKDQITNESELQNIIKEILAQNTTAIEDYKKGKTASLEYLLGQVMRATKGKADTGIARQLLINSIRG